MENKPHSHSTPAANGVRKDDAYAHEVEMVETPPDHSQHGGLDEKALGGHPAEAFVVHHKMTWKLFLSLTAMSFLWIGSQIPLYLYGSVLPLIYSDIGGVDRYVWFAIGYLIPNAALCPFVGAFSDMFGRQKVAIVGQILLIIGPVVTATAHNMNVAIAGQVISGLGAGLNELIALAGTAEMVPVSKRGYYVGAVVFTILPFTPSVVYAQLIAKASNWRYVGIPVGIWNAIGLFLVMFCYKDPPRLSATYTKRDVLRQIDYVGGILSIGGVLGFMMGLQWGAQQYSWHSAHVLAPLILGIIMIIAFFIWEIFFAPYPMAPRRLFSKDKKTMTLILLITFLSGGNYFALLLFWPTQTFNVYGYDPVAIGLRSLPIGFGIIGGAFICLFLIPLTSGKINYLMIFFTTIMTAFTGAMSASTPSNISLMYVLVTFASLGVGGVIIPSSIIAQLCCPDDLIATITAITLSIRYIGGAIGFTAYDNIFYHNFLSVSADIVITDTILAQGLVVYPANATKLPPTDPSLLPYTGTAIELLTLAANAEYQKLKAFIATSPLVNRKPEAFDIVIKGTQEAFALGYRYPYWMSIAFGGLCLILSLFLKDIRGMLSSDRVAAVETREEAKEGVGHVEGGGDRRVGV